MKRILTTVVSFALASVAMFAQDNFKSHWFVQGQVGASHTIGEAKFKDLISPAAQLSVGYQFTPVFGARLSAIGWEGKGAIVVPQQNVYKFNYVGTTLDAIVNVANIFADYKCNRLFNPYVLAGVGGATLFNNKEARDVYTQIDPNFLPCRKSDFPWKNTVGSFMGKVGVGVNVPVCKNLAVNVEANSCMFQDKFNSKKDTKIDANVNALVGLTYRFGGCNKVVVVEEVVEVVEPVAKQPQKEQIVVEQKQAPVQEESKPIVKNVAFQGLTQNVLFLIREYEIRASELGKIDAIVAALKANPTAKVKIVGHADKETGTAKFNMKLSQKRAAEVAKALENAGIDAERIITEAVGDTQSVSSVAAENRVAVVVVK